MAGGVPINRSGPRVSSDIDIFHDRQERVATAAEADVAILRGHGLTVDWLRQQPAIYSASVRSGNDETKLEWVADSDFRYFPAIQDHELGFVLSLADLAVNKVMAAAGRREARDLVDLVTLNDQFLPLGAIVWAAVEVAPGFTPEGLIAEIRRNSRYPGHELAEIVASPPIDPQALMQRLREVLDAAEAFVARMPSERVGRYFLKDGRVVEPDPANLDACVEHAPHRSGHWPTSPEIERAMLERYLAGCGKETPGS